MMFEKRNKNNKRQQYFCRVKLDMAEILLSFCVINCGCAVILLGSIIFIAKCR